MSGLSALPLDTETDRAHADQRVGGFLQLSTGALQPVYSHMESPRVGQPHYEALLMGSLLP